MKKACVEIEYKDTVYRSDEVEMNEDEFVGITNFAKKAVSGQVSYFSIKQGDKELYFGPKILKKSVITIIEIK